MLAIVPAWAACNLSNFNATLQSTGTGPFNTGDACTPGGSAHTAGNDACGTDSVVRTNDTYIYRFNYKVAAGATENNITFQSTLPLVGGRKVSVWDGLPPQCIGAGSSVSADGRTLVCNIGTVDQSAGGDLTSALLAQVKTTPLGANNDVVAPPAATVTTNECTAAPSVPAPVTLSARQKTDFKKDFPFNGGQQPFTLNGQSGYLVSWYIYMDQFDPAGASSKGGESLNSPITLTDVPSNFPAGSVWFDCGRAENQQGNISCPAQGTPVGASQPVTISARPGEAGEFMVAGGRNTNIQQDPNTPAPQRLGTFYQRFWVPLSAINGQVNLRNDIPANQISGTTASGALVQDAQPNNNGQPITVVASGPGQLYKYVARQWSGSPWAGPTVGAPSQGEIQMTGTNNYGDSGTGVTFPGQPFYPLLRYYNPNATAATNVVLCDNFDNTEVKLREIPQFPGHAAAFRYEGGPHGGPRGEFPSGYTVEYGVARSGSGNPGGSSTCDDADATWYPTLTAAGVAADNVNKVRMKVPLLAPGSSTEFVIAHEARPNVNGTLLDDYMVAKGGTLTGGNPAGWTTSGYNVDTNNGVALGKRFKLTTSLARIQKNASLNAGGPSINQASAGGSVTYSLTPSLQSVVGGLPPTFITIVDRLPAPLQYIDGSASVAPDSVQSDTGGTTITWTLNGLVPNSAIPDLTFKVNVPQTIPPNTAVVNTAVINTPDDSSDVSQRTAQKPLTVLNPPGVKVFKSTSTPSIDPNGTAKWKIEVINFENAPTTADVIDVLPYVGDARTPATAYSGTRGIAAAITNINPGAGATVYYSSRASNTVNIDPNGQAATVANGWCLASQFGAAGCPANFAAVTAFRVTGIAIPANAIAAIDYDTPTSGNQVNDVYTNRFTTKTSDPALATLRSNDVKTTVKLGSISGKVYRDDDGNATQGGTEAAIPGVLITLCKVDPASSGGVCPATSIQGTATTAANGSYNIPNVPSGPYWIVEAQPTGYTNGPNNAAGSLGGTPGTNIFSAINLPVGANGTNYNFGERGTDLSTRTQLPPAVNANTTTTGTVTFSNISGVASENTTATIKLTPNLPAATVTPPPGWTVISPYNPATGEIQLRPPAGAMTPNSSVNIPVTFTPPFNGDVSLSSSITNTLADATPITDPASPDPKKNADRATVKITGPQIDTRKRAGSPLPLGSTTAPPVTAPVQGFLVPYAISVGNKSPVTVASVQAADYLPAPFSTATTITVVSTTYTGVFTAPATAAPACTPNPTAYNGSTQPNFFSGNFNLLPGQACDVAMLVAVQYPNGAAIPTAAQQNNVYASGGVGFPGGVNPGPTFNPGNPSGTPTFPAGTYTSDKSTDSPQVPLLPAGQVPTAPGLGSSPAGGDTPDPTNVNFSGQAIDVRKSSSYPVQLDVSGRRFRVAYTVNVSNTGAGTATNVQLSENLKFTYPAPATFAAGTVTIASGSAAQCANHVNAEFDGGAAFTGSNARNYNLLRNSASAADKASNLTLAPGQACVVSFVADVNYGPGIVQTDPLQAQNRVFGQTASAPNDGPPFDPATGTKSGDNPNVIDKDTSTNVDPATRPYGTPPPNPGPPATPKSDSGSGSPAIFKTLEVKKAVTGPVVTISKGRYRVPYRVIVTALGPAGEVLPNVQVVDNLRPTFTVGNPTLTVANYAVANTNGATGCAAPGTAYAGVNPAITMLSGNASLTVGQACQISFDLTVDYGVNGAVPTPAQLNTAYASAAPGAGANTGGTVPDNSGPGSTGTATGVWTAPANVIAKDASTDGITPPAPATPALDNPLPTPVAFTPAPPVQGIKYVENLDVPGAPVVSGNNIQWMIVYKNDGANAATNVQVTDSLHPGLTAAQIVSVELNPPNPNAQANAAYTGAGANTALLSSPVALVGNGILMIKLKATITPSFVGSLTNQAVLTSAETGGASGTPLPTSAVDPGFATCPQTNACIPSGVTVPPDALKSHPTPGTPGKDQPNTLAVVPGGSLSGIAWFDGNKNSAIDGGEARVPGLRVAVYAIDAATGARIKEVTNPQNRPVTDANGAYSVSGLPPSAGGGPEYEVVFYNETGQAVLGAPAAQNPNAAVNGQVPPTNDKITKIKVVSGQNTEQQNLPLDPSGIVYDAVTRNPVPGAVVTITGPAGFDPLIHLLGGAGNASQTTGATGLYQFVLTPTAPPGNYSIGVTPPPSYVFQSTLIPPTPGPFTPPAGAGLTFPVQPQVGAPPQGAANTTYYLQFNLTPGSSRDVVHNHIPLDPGAQARIALAKTVNKPVAEFGDVVTYNLRLRNIGTFALSNLLINDRLPAGFRYIPGTSQISTTAGTSTAPTALVALPDPAGSPGPTLNFSIPGAVQVNGEVSVYYKVRLGVGSLQGDGINRAQARSGALVSNEARAKVKVEPGVFTSEVCVAGKVYVDCNNNHLQDAEELGVPGVRLYLEDGTHFITDSEGKYSYCGLTPKSHVLKVDLLTMPRGSRLTTTSSRNLGDAGSLFLDVKNGELTRGDFAEGSCSNTILEQVKSRRTQGEVRAPETEKKGQPAKKFEGKSPNYPQQGTDGANQPLVVPRPPTGGSPSNTEQDQPVPTIPGASGNTRGGNIRDTK